MPLQLPVLKINHCKIERLSSTTFLGVKVDEHLNWKDRINITENKLSENVGLLNTKAKKILYLSFIHSCLTYGNVAWCSTSVSKTKKSFSQQKQATKTIPMKDIHANSNSDEKNDM